MFFLSVFLILGVFSCSRDPGPPAPLAVEQIPAELNKTFQHAKPEVRELVTKLTAALQTKDYPAAYQAVQALGNAQGSTKEQQELAARVMLEITRLLQTAQAQGDENANMALKVYQSGK